MTAKEIKADDALRIMQQIMHLAQQRKPLEPISICVMGADQVTVCAVRMYHACSSTVAHAEGKARTALAFKRDTRDFAKDWSPEDLANARSAMPGFISWGGGVLIYNAEGAIAGAVAVSGLTEEDDHKLAAAGCKEWHEWSA